ncbi:hypothetical protein [Streptomyces aureus]|uniref:hypothetical protein n=1 Tax=Streptomyces aureus TaxID=193461 RepID=UPI0031DEE7B9
MGLDLINGIPAHVLLVHIVVVLVPLTALALILCAALPSAMAGSDSHCRFLPWCP